MMKNIHILPTENYKQDYTTMRGEVLEVVRLGQLILNKETNQLSVNKSTQWAASCDTDVLVPHHIYISCDDEEIKDGDWVYYENGYLKGIHKVVNGQRPKTMILRKIILTTDQDLINDGIQEIDDEFLEWFVKNTSCEFVEIKYYVVGSGFTRIGKTPSKQESLRGCYDNGELLKGKWEDCYKYKIIIPKEEFEANDKQQTAVELLKQDIDSELQYGTKMVVNWDMYLAMEQEQIQKAFKEGYECNKVDEVFEIKETMFTAERYYNDTFGDTK